MVRFCDSGCLTLPVLVQPINLIAWLPAHCGPGQSVARAMAAPRVVEKVMSDLNGFLNWRVGNDLETAASYCVCMRVRVCTHTHTHTYTQFLSLSLARCLSYLQTVARGLIGGESGEEDNGWLIPSQTFWNPQPSWECWVRPWLQPVEFCFPWDVVGVCIEPLPLLDHWPRESLLDVRSLLSQFQVLTVSFWVKSG